MEKTKKFGFVTVTFDEDEHGVKTIKKMKFLGNSKYEFKVDGAIEIDGNEDGKLNTYDEIVKFLQGMPEGANLKEMMDHIDPSGLTPEEQQAIEELINAEDITDEAAEDMWDEAMRNAGLDLDSVGSGGSMDVDDD